MSGISVVFIAAFWKAAPLVSQPLGFLYSFMARREKSGIISWLLDRMSDWAVDLLTKPIKSYALHIPNDIAALKRHIRKGDVILVEGNERISECIKYLTQSSWSHSALYVGDEPIRRNPELKAPLVASALIGLFSAMVPASSAARRNIVDALRTVA